MAQGTFVVKILYITIENWVQYQVEMGVRWNVEPTIVDSRNVIFHGIKGTVSREFCFNLDCEGLD